ncbi:MAG: murein hydrolase activator EnvC family protein [Euzebya sp.]
MDHIRTRFPRRATTGVAAAFIVALLVAPTAAGGVDIAGSPSAPPPPNGAVRPVAGPVIRPFDLPTGPYGPGHRGVDLAASGGEPVRAALAGSVLFAGMVAQVGWVTVDHGGGLRTTYGYLVDRVAAGTDVTAGEVIGHLHEDRVHLDWGATLDGDYFDPISLLVRWPMRLTTPSRLSAQSP